MADPPRWALLGRLLKLDNEPDEDGGISYCLNRFDADLGDGFFLLRRLCPRHGTEFPGSWIVSLAALAAKPEGTVEIYEDFDAFLADHSWLLDEDEDGEDEPDPGTQADRVLQ
jgi:hypothetical protein